MLRPFDKPFLSFTQQIDLLKERGLSFADEVRAIDILSHCNYYRLSGYMRPFQIGSSHQFFAGTTFERICMLYHFDQQLRQLVLEAIEVLEISARTKIAYRLAEYGGAFAHTDKDFFAPYGNRVEKYQWHNNQWHDEWLGKVDAETKKSREPFVEHFCETYSDPYLPIWVAVEIMSFGELSKLYQKLPDKIKKKIATDYDTPKSVFASWLHSLTSVRNTCAHHARLWNRRLGVKPEIPEADIWNDFRGDGFRDKPFFVISILNFLFYRITGAVDWSHTSWCKRLVAILDNPPEVPQFERAMGIPANWKKLEVWRNDVEW